MNSTTEGHKTCPTCQADKPLTDFHRDRRAHDGVQSRCKTCQIAIVVAYSTTDHSKVKGAAKRAREYGVENALSLAQWLGILSKQRGLCSMCDEPATRIDHIVPMSLGGPNTPKNAQGLCERHERQKTGFDLRMIWAVRRHKMAVAS